MTTSSLVIPTSALVGLQAPRIRTVPAYVASKGPAAIELCEMAGLHLDPWQQQDLIDALGVRADGKWAAFEVGEVDPRQNGKGGIEEAREITGLFVLGERLLIHSAHEQRTSSEHFRRVEGLILNDKRLHSRVKKNGVKHGKGSESIELKSGQRIMFITRTSGGGRGLTGDLVILDEAMILPEDMVGALVPTMAAMSIYGNPQLWYGGSAVDQEKHDHGVVLARVRERALAGAPRLAYFERSAHIGDPAEDHPSKVTYEMRHDPDRWAEANPGLGVRISAEFIENEANGALGPRTFAVERLGIGDWPDTTEDGDRKIPSAMWANVLDEGSKVLDPVWLIFDMPETRETVSIAAVGRREDGEIHGEIIEHDLAPGVAAEKLALLAKKRRPAGVLYDELGPAGRSDMPAALKRLKVRRLRPITTQEFAQACGTFYDVVKGGTFHHTGQPCLDDAVEGAETRPLVDAWAWSRKNSTANAAPLVAVTIGAWAEATLAKPKAGIVDLAAALAQAEAEGR